MHEDDVLDRAITKYVADGWRLVYKTRPIAEGAIGGVDAILIKKNPWRFVFVDAKGHTDTKEKRSSGFTNCLGALMKRIRVDRGYSGNEDGDRFIPGPESTAKACRDQVAEHGKHKNSEYILAITADMRGTVEASLDAAVAALLHVKVLLVSDSGIEEMQW